MAGEALTDISDIIYRMTGGTGGYPEITFFHKLNSVNAATPTPDQNRWMSLWRYAGQPGNGALTHVSTPSIPTRTTAGALGQSNATGVGAKRWCVGMTIASSVGGVFVLYDRLAMNGTLTATASFSMTIDRYSDYTIGETIGNQIWLEVGTTGNLTSGAVITVSYLDQDNNASTTGSFTTSTSDDAPNSMIPMPLASGDTGVTAVTGVTCTGTAITTNNFGVVILRPLLSVVVPYNGGGEQRDVIAGLPQPFEIKSNACLSLMMMNPTTTAPTIFGHINTLEK